MKKYKPYLGRVDLVKNQVAREKLAEQEAKRKRSAQQQQQNRQRWLKYQEQLRSELAARYFHGVVSTGGEADTFSNTKSLDFDGVDAFVDMGNPASLQITGNLTLSAWVKKDPTSTASNYVIIGKDGLNASTRSYLLIVNSSTNKAQFFIWKSATNYSVASTTTISSGVWYHIMGVNDGTDLKIYVNGVLENTNVGGGGTIDGGVSPFNIGRRATGPAQRGYWNGLIDEVAVWNSDQSANASAIGSTIPTDLSTYSPLSWWRCGDGDTSPTLTDNGSGGNNGTMIAPEPFSTDVPG